MFVFWVHASTKARFEEAYRDIADRLELPGRQNPKADVLRLVRNWLCDETNGQWTMILDNVDDVETFFSAPKRKEDKPSGSPSASLAAYLPQSRNGSILVTSRSMDTAARLVGSHKNMKEVQAMNESQSIQLLQSKLQDASIEEGTADLLCALDYMPLAITQAAAYINRRARMTISKYLDEFRRNDKKKQNLLNWDAGDLRRDESASNSVVITWQMSFERIREDRPSAADLLSLMSFFNPQGIPEWILRDYSKNATEVSDEDEADSAFDEDLDTLQAYSLITATAETDVCKMHALVQFCTQVWLSSFGAMERWRQEFLGLMAKEFPVGKYEGEEYKYWAKCQGLLLHVESLSEREPTNDESLKAWAQVLTNITWYMGMKGKFGVARESAANAVRVREQGLGKDNPDTLKSLNVLALALRDQGKYDEAEKIHRRVLGEREKELGVQHLDTLTSMNHLAVVLHNQGKYSEAEKLAQRALEGRKKELGVQHPDTLTSMNNIARVLRYQGNFKAAEEINLLAMEGRKKVLKEDYSETMAIVDDLAWVMQEQGKYKAAKKMALRAVE
jgi:tetratricopeptide (TPR) repeat protein